MNSARKGLNHQTMLEDYQRLGSQSAVARKYGCSVQNVFYIRQKRGVPTLENKFFRKVDYSNLVKNYKQLRSVEKVALLLGVDPSCAREALLKKGVKLREQGDKSIKITLPLIEASVETENVRMAKARKYSVNEAFFEKWTPKMAYVLGFMVADGCIYGDRFISFTNNERYLLEAVRSFILSDYPIKKMGNCLQLVMTNKKLYIDLVKLGVTERKSKTIAFPKVPEQFLPYFLQGLIDGDGSVLVENSVISTEQKQYGYKRLIIQIASGSQLFLDGLKKTFPFLDRRRWEVGVNHRKAEKFGEWIYSNPLVESRKYKNYMEYKVGL